MYLYSYYMILFLSTAGALVVTTVQLFAHYSAAHSNSTLTQNNIYRHACYKQFIYDYIFSETNFTQEKSHFSSNHKNHHCSILLPAVLSQNATINIGMVGGNHRVRWFSGPSTSVPRWFSMVVHHRSNNAMR